MPPITASTPAFASDDDELDIAPEVSSRISTIMREGIAYAHRHKGTVQGETMLDDTIYQMRLMGLSTRDIASRLGGSITEDEVARRIGIMLARMDDMSPAEYKQLQIGRLEALVNFCWTMAKGGSADHVELILKTIERINRMLELETDKSRVEIELVTTHQAALIMSVVGGVLRCILGDPRVLQVIPREEINQIAAQALDVASGEISSAQTQVLVQPQARTARLVAAQRS